MPWRSARRLAPRKCRRSPRPIARYVPNAPLSADLFLGVLQLLRGHLGFGFLGLLTPLEHRAHVADVLLAKIAGKVREVLVFLFFDVMEVAVLQVEIGRASCRERVC